MYQNITETSFFKLKKSQSSLYLKSRIKSQEATAILRSQKIRMNSQKKIAYNIKRMMTIFKQPTSNPQDQKVDHLETQLLKAQDITYPQSNFISGVKFKPAKSRLINHRLLTQLPQIHHINLKTDTDYVEQVHSFRKTQSLKQPKQWHFHNCLNLQKIQLYKTNLKLSCQSWILIDFLQLKYLRGWNPKNVYDFSPMIRLVIALICFELQQDRKIDFTKNIVHTNIAFVNYIDSWQLGLKHSSFISFRELLVGILFTNFEDLIRYMILAIGAILSNPNFKDEVILLETDKQSIKEYEKYFQKKVQEICLKHMLKQTKLKLTSNSYQLQSSSLDISIIYMFCLKNSIFAQLMSCKEQKFTLRYQIAWNFFQNRSEVWKNSNKFHKNLYGIRKRSSKTKNQCLVLHNATDNVIVAMADCKINMCLQDLQGIKRWYQQRIYRFKDHTPKKKDPDCSTRYKFLNQELKKSKLRSTLSKLKTREHFNY